MTQEQFLVVFQNYQYPALLLNLVGEVIVFNPATKTYFIELTSEARIDLGLKFFFASINQAILIKKNLTINRHFLGYDSQLKFSLINTDSEPVILLLIEPEVPLSKSWIVDQESLDTTIQVLVHELKAPLVTIFGFSSALEEDYSENLDQQGKNFLESINRSARSLDDKLMALVELTEVSRQSKKQELVGFKEILQDACRVLKSVIEKRSPQIITITDLPNISCNRELMIKVMVNLISNAVKFTPQEHQPIIKIGCELQPKAYKFWVQDQGIGIDPRLQKKVFELFYRVRELQKVSGVGLGLALVKRIIQAHNGKLTVDSKPGIGSCFYFTIPKLY